MLYNNDELENIVKKMRINLGKVAVKSYQIFWLYSIATLVCSKKLNVSYEEKIVNVWFLISKTLKYVNSEILILAV